MSRTLTGLAVLAFAAAASRSGRAQTDNFPLCGMRTTVFAASGTDNAWDAAVDAAGNVYVTGISDSPDLPVTAGAYDTTYNGNSDAYVLKVSPAGAVVWGTYLGGTMLDQGSKVKTDWLGNVFVAGYTYSTDFPTTTGAFDTTFNGQIDAFVAKLLPDGSALSYSTYLGGAADDFGGGLVVDSSGRAIITGYSESPAYPTTAGAFDTSYNGGGDVVVTKLSPSGAALVFSTFVGGSGFESGYGIAVSQGLVYVSGQTSSQNFPVTSGAFQTIYGGGVDDAFVLKLNASGSALAYATYLGGPMFDDSHALAVDYLGQAYVAGRTESGIFPTTPGSYDPTYNGGRDVFASKLAASGASLVWSTFLGGTGEEEPGDIVVDASNGVTYGTGWTASSDFPVSGDACMNHNAGGYDAFLWRLSFGGNQLLYGTYIGWGGDDYGRGLGLDGNKKVRIAGYTGQTTVDAFCAIFR